MGNSFSLANDPGLELPLQSIVVPRMERHICRPEPSTGKPKICFGPHYDDPSSASLTCRTFHYIASKSGGNTEEVLQVYKAAVNNDIVREARKLYKYHAAHIVYLTDKEFQLRMIHGGCTMLLMSLHCLGYSLDHEAFGTQWSPQYQKECFQDIFFPGNQICLLVLRKLLEQAFFKRIIEETKWRKPSDLLGKALYLCLLKPTPNITYEVSCLDAINTYTCSASEDIFYDRPCEVLHALHMLVLGRGDYVHSGNGISVIPDEPNLSTASILKTKGIGFKGVKGGIRGIKFEHNMFGRGRLFMPAIPGFNVVKGGIRGIKFNGNLFGLTPGPANPADELIELVLQILVLYESTDNFRGEGKDKYVTSYVGLMTDLIRTTPDTKILARKGVIPNDLIFRNNLPGMLGGMNCTVTCEHINYVKLQVRDYSGVDWPKLFYLVVAIVGIIGIVPAVFSVLEYLKKP